MLSNTMLFSSMMLLGAEASFRRGSCPDWTRQQNFDLDAYYGNWYEAVRDYGTTFEIAAKCVTANYSENDDGTSRVRNNAYYSLLGWSGKTAVAYDIGVDGGLYVSFSGKTPNDNTTANYNVISTDYTNYSIVYSCTDYRFFAYELLWVLSREPVIADDVLR